jgi:hypothetical protein
LLQEFGVILRKKNVNLQPQKIKNLEKSGKNFYVRKRKSGFG